MSMAIKLGADPVSTLLRGIGITRPHERLLGIREGMPDHQMAQTHAVLERASATSVGTGVEDLLGRYPRWGRYLMKPMTDSDGLPQLKSDGSPRYAKIPYHGIVPKPILAKAPVGHCVEHDPLVTSDRVLTNPNAGIPPGKKALGAYWGPGKSLHLPGLQEDCPGLMVLDLDSAIDPATGNPKPWARKIVESIPSYWEHSPSGTGLRGVVRSKDGLPERVANRDQASTAIVEHNQRLGSFEIYCGLGRSRHVTITGQILPGAPNVVAELDSSVLEAALSALPMPRRAEQAATEPASKTPAYPTLEQLPPLTQLPLPDRVRRVLEIEDEAELEQEIGNRAGLGRITRHLVRRRSLVAFGRLSISGLRSGPFLPGTTFQDPNLLNHRAADTRFPVAPAISSAATVAAPQRHILKVISSTCACIK